MLCPAHGITNGGSLFRSRRRTVGVGDFQKHISGNATGALHHLRCVAGEVPLKNLEDTAGMLEGGVGLKLARILSFATTIFGVPSSNYRVPCLRPSSLLGRGPLVKPGLGIVFLSHGVPAGEEPVKVLGAAEVLAQEGAGVGVVE